MIFFILGLVLGSIYGIARMCVVVRRKYRRARYGTPRIVIRVERA